MIFKCFFTLGLESIFGFVLKIYICIPTEFDLLIHFFHYFYNILLVLTLHIFLLVKT